VPIRSSAITVGVLFVSVPPPRQITPEQMKLLESLTEMVGASLQRMSLYEATVRQLDQLQSLHDIDLAITASMDLRMTLNILLSHVLTQLKVDAANVLLLNPHLQTLEYAAGRGFRTDALKNTRLRLGEGYAGRAALELKLVHLPDLRGRKTDFLRSPFFSAEGFVAYFGIPLIAKGQVKGVLEIFHRAPLAAGPDWVNLLETLTGQAAIAIDNAQLFDNLQRSNIDLALAYDATIKGWSRTLDLRDRETEGHTQRVTELTERLARAMDISEAEIVHIRRGALLHDIGKMGVPDDILFKPDKLTDDEWVLMRKHPQLAFDLLAPITYLKPALNIPLCHHEKWDGTGYPRGLKGEQIPLAARLFAVVDVWDALRYDRPYRKAWPEEKALEYIHAESGKHFDPQVVKVFERIIGEG
jgi:HD-GYP domain-containing protein (c-di-GMP phosphodiesterase class II)